eukprot:7031205-Prymnesium_polylepis.1
MFSAFQAACVSLMSGTPGPAAPAAKISAAMRLGSLSLLAAFSGWYCSNSGLLGSRLTGGVPTNDHSSPFGGE